MAFSLKVNKDKAALRDIGSGPSFIATSGVYDVTVNNKQSNLIFSYAKSKGINVIIPNNMLKNRNIICSQQNTNEYA